MNGMVVGLYNPYLETLGGGERYIISLASYLSGMHDVRIFWDDPGILKRAHERFGLDLSRVTIEPNIWKPGRLMRKLTQSAAYDRIIIVSDGSIPLSFAKKTYLIVQFPIPWVRADSPVSRFKLRRIDGVIVYSDFVKRHIDPVLRVDSRVIPPGIPVSEFTAGKKAKTILTVGRFTQGMNTKKQEVLIEAFKRIHEAKKAPGWRLVVAGGVRSEDEKYVKHLADIAQGYPISIESNVKYSRLRRLYASASVYWHGAGYGEDLSSYPHYAEHFGITVVEAMAAGCVPIVFDGGGLPEIVTDGKNGFVWKTPEELITKTLAFIQQPAHAKKLADAAAGRAHDFEERNMLQQFAAYLELGS